MVFEGEGVPLTEDVIKRKEDFSQTWMEWAAQDNTPAQFFNLTQLSALGSANLRVVGANETLYITSAWISASTQGAKGHCFIEVDGTTLQLLHINPTTSVPQSLALSYPMPLKVQSGQTLRLTCTGAGATPHADAGVMGFIIPKRIN